MTTTALTCLSCMKTGTGIHFPLTPKSGASFGTICTTCDSKSAWSKKTLACVDCELELTDDTAWGNRAYGDPRCEDCHIEYKLQ